jgi:MoxR-like ATPase
MTGVEIPAVKRVVTPGEVLAARDVVNQVYMDDRVKDYVVDIVFATRAPKDYKLDMAPLIAFGASPRATIFLTVAAKAHAFIKGRGFATPEDVKSIAFDVLRHRVLLTYEAEAEDVTPESIVQRILDTLEVP